MEKQDFFTEGGDISGVQRKQTLLTELGAEVTGIIGSRDFELKQLVFWTKMSSLLRGGG